MSIQDFQSTKNINLLWDVIKEEEILISCSTEVVNHFKLFIQSTLKDFYEQEKGSVSQLQQMNKKYIIYIVNYIHYFLKSKVPSNSKQTISISNETPEPVTFEDLQKERTSIFDKKLQEKQFEFTNAIKNKIPETPNFSDVLDKPLVESKSLVEKMVQQRMMEEEQFKNRVDENTYHSTWIKPVETSIKKDKLSYSTPDTKYIKIENELLTPINEVIDLDSSNKTTNNINSNLKGNSNLKKHITWKEDINNENISEIVQDNINIFSKLKKIEKKDDYDDLKEEVKIIHTKLSELDNTINNILNWMKENKK